MGEPEGEGKDSSFCEQKEAKKLYPLAHGLPREGWVPRGKSFLLLFFKKEDSYLLFNG
jgi:hypothetical protein